MKINKQNDILNGEKKLTRDIKNIITEDYGEGVSKNVNSIITNNSGFIKKGIQVEGNSGEKGKIYVNSKDEIDILLKQILKMSNNQSAQTNYEYFSTICENIFEKLEGDDEVIIQAKKEALETYLSLSINGFIDYIVSVSKVLKGLKQENSEDLEVFKKMTQKRNHEYFIRIVNLLEPFISITESELEELGSLRELSIDSSHNALEKWNQKICFQGEQISFLIEQIFELIKDYELDYNDLFLGEASFIGGDVKGLFNVIKYGNYLGKDRGIKEMKIKSEEYYNEVFKFVTSFMGRYTNIIDISDYINGIILPEQVKIYGNKKGLNIYDVKFSRR